MSVPSLVAFRRILPLAVAGVALTASGCAERTPTGPEGESVATLTLNAEKSWSFARLGSSATAIDVADPSTSAEWDLAFYATSVMLNGGAAGPGGVTGYCLCQNQGATDAQVKAMTPESQLAAFRAVTAAQIPADTLWKSDALRPALTGWYRYDPQTHVVSAASEKSWKVRTAEGAAFAKLRVARVEGAARTHAGKVTLEFAAQSAKGAPMGETRSLTVDLAAGGKVYVDLVRGAVTDAADWDLVLEGYTIRVNGGVSGKGQAGVVLVDAPFAGIADASDMDRHYRADAFGGVFDEKRWYRYNLDGNHQIWPTYDVYLVRRGSRVYKLQVTGYYGPAGESRHVTFRYARLSS